MGLKPTRPGKQGAVSIQTEVDKLSGLEIELSSAN